MVHVSKVVITFPLKFSKNSKLVPSDDDKSDNHEEPHEAARQQEHEPESHKEDTNVQPHKHEAEYPYSTPHASPIEEVKSEEFSEDTKKYLKAFGQLLLCILVASVVTFLLFAFFGSKKKFKI
jgi:hypothetical protein